MTSMETAMSRALADPQPSDGSKPPRPKKEKVVSRPKKPQTSLPVAPPQSVPERIGTIQVSEHPLPRFFQQRSEEEEQLEAQQKAQQEMELAINDIMAKNEPLDRLIQTTDQRTLRVGGILLRKCLASQEIVRRLQTRIKTQPNQDGFDLLVLGTYEPGSTVDWRVSWTPQAKLWLGHLLRRLRQVELRERGLLHKLTLQQLQDLDWADPLDFPGGDTWKGDLKVLTITNVQVSHLELRQVFSTLTGAMSETRSIYRPKRSDPKLAAIRRQASS